MSRRRQTYIMPLGEYESLRNEGYLPPEILVSHIGLSMDDFVICDVVYRRPRMKVEIEFDIINDNFFLEGLERRIEPPRSMAIERRNHYTRSAMYMSSFSSGRAELYGRSPIQEYIQARYRKEKLKSSIDILRDEVKEWLSDALT